MSSCVAVKELLVDNPSFENLNKIQEMFAEFAEKAYSLQSKMHDRIDYLEDLFNSKPEICKHKRMVDGVASATKTIQIILPKMLDKMRNAYGQIDRFRPSPSGILVEIPDYSDQIKSLSNKIMSDIQANAVDSMAKMGFVVEDLLGKQVKQVLIISFE